MGVVTAVIYSRIDHDPEGGQAGGVAGAGAGLLPDGRAARLGGAGAGVAGERRRRPHPVEEAPAGLRADAAGRRGRAQGRLGTPWSPIRG
jgi:hypothetical protein